MPPLTDEKRPNKTGLLLSRQALFSPLLVVDYFPFILLLSGVYWVNLDKKVESKFSFLTWKHSNLLQLNLLPRVWCKKVKRNNFECGLKLFQCFQKRCLFLQLTFDGSLHTVNFFKYFPSADFYKDSFGKTSKYFTHMHTWFMKVYHYLAHSENQQHHNTHKSTYYSIFLQATNIFNQTFYCF